MELIKRNYAFGTNIEKSVDAPLHCPHCGLPTGLRLLQHGDVSDGERRFFVVAAYSYCCSKYSFLTYLLEENEYTFVNVYPKSTGVHVIEAIETLSPRFADLYKASASAESDGFLELAGSGYRNALEVLVKDFAIEELKIPSSDVVKKSLADAIELYLPDERLKNAADVVRILGNDFTHYERKYDHYDLNILKTYLDIFIARIHSEYLLNHPPVHRPT
ncbi:MAG: DUF4145 domain-containing protein [Saccharofermentanales bacterium]|jgi:hypothetical protein|nr:DUF4145 domain-containing protein [Clostridiaceae bacterium]